MTDTETVGDLVERMRKVYSLEAKRSGSVDDFFDLVDSCLDDLGFSYRIDWFEIAFSNSATQRFDSFPQLSDASRSKTGSDSITHYSKIRGYYSDGEFIIAETHHPSILLLAAGRYSDRKILSSTSLSLQKKVANGLCATMIKLLESHSNLGRFLENRYIVMADKAYELHPSHLIEAVRARS